MRVIPVLRSPVPEGGRYMTKSEADSLTFATGIQYTTSAIMGSATPDGWTAFIIGCSKQTFILVDIKGDRPPGVAVVPCLSSPVPEAGRCLTQYEVLRLRRAGVSCSTLTFVRLLPDGSGAKRWVRGGWSPAWPVLTEVAPAAPGRRPVVPEGCCCWACAAVGCSVRRSGSGG